MQPIVVDPSFMLFGSSRIAKLQVAIKLSENDGRVMLCSAIAAKGVRSSALRYIEDWRDGASVSVNEDTITGGLTHALLYDGEGHVRGKLAGCSVTGDEWQAAYASAPLVLRYDDWTPSGGSMTFRIGKVAWPSSMAC
ncbi:MAG: hypothetical protein ACPGSI_01720 [Pikeienuella sp.]